MVHVLFLHKQSMPLSPTAGWVAMSLLPDLSATNRLHVLVVYLAGH
jgi:hypothetical protein